MTPDEERLERRALSNSYLRIRGKLEPWGALNTNHGGANRFEKTEDALDGLLQERYAIRAALQALADRVVLLDNPHDEGIAANDATVLAAYDLLRAQ